MRHSIRRRGVHYVARLFFTQQPLRADLGLRPCHAMACAQDVVCSLPPVQALAVAHRLHRGEFAT